MLLPSRATQGPSGLVDGGTVCEPCQLRAQRVSRLGPSPTGALFFWRCPRCGSTAEACRLHGPACHLPEAHGGACEGPAGLELPDHARDPRAARIEAMRAAQLAGVLGPPRRRL